MINIVDYGVGNIFSLKSSLDYLGIKAELTGDPEKILASEKVILPGVGSFGDAMEMLKRRDLIPAILQVAKKGTPLLGICLGMQILFQRGFEYGEREGLGLISGSVEDMNKLLKDKELPLPQMGWNAISFPKDREKSPLFKYTPEGSYVYFVHSYSAVNCEDSIIATCDYSYPVTAAVAKDNIFGTQFHPEKSGEVGLNILKAFHEL
ncbi:MAG: imidazole glycerol phosphate synthase subunit HisH [Firmicutes bacterium]|nr:imidazole glycerol phosphate synthase subunit HisH [Bacillota bacterium]